MNETNTRSVPRMRTLPNGHQELNDMGIPIPMHALRMWVKQGKIPAVYCGKKALINLDAVIEFLERGDQDERD